MLKQFQSGMSNLLGATVTPWNQSESGPGQETAWACRKWLGFGSGRQQALPLTSCEILGRPSVPLIRLRETELKSLNQKSSITDHLIKTFGVGFAAVPLLFSPSPALSFPFSFMSWLSSLSPSFARGHPFQKLQRWSGDTWAFMTLTTLAEVTTELGRHRLPIRVTQRRTVRDPQTKVCTEDTTIKNYSLWSHHFFICKMGLQTWLWV